MFAEGLLESAWPVVLFDQIDSTSAEATRMVERGRIEPVWIRAVEQTGGRGRLGRKWVSEPGNLYTTLLLPLEKLTTDVPCLALVVGLAVHDLAIELTHGRVTPGLKWPNDVRIDGAKISGILLESGNNAYGQIWLAIGIGVNLASAPKLEGYKTASLTELTGLIIDPAQALEQLDAALRSRLRQIVHRGRASIIEDWMAVTDQIGQSCRTTYRNELIEGKFVGLDDSGMLKLETRDGRVITVTAGDVELVREMPNASGN